MALQAGARCEARQGFCFGNQKSARMSLWMGSERQSPGVAIFFSTGNLLCPMEKKGSTSGSKQEKADMLLTTDRVPLRRLARDHHWLDAFL